MVHNRYQEQGGEDVSTEAEINLLREHGHDVRLFGDDNRRIRDMSRFVVAGATVWNQSTVRRLGAEIDVWRPDVAHFHNTFPLISPAAYYAVRDRGVPIVQTLHNYRLLCSNALFFRNGKVCERCLDSRVNPWGVVYGCYRGSRLANAAISMMLAAHHLLGTYSRQVNAYIALTEFARNKFVDGGLPPHKVHVKPNCVFPDPGTGSGGGGFVLYAGRLTEEKGIRLLIETWKSGIRYPLKVVGTGPLERWLLTEIGDSPWIEWMGPTDNGGVIKLMKCADLLVFPSRWFEGMPRILVEALATGLPAIVPNFGGMASMIAHDANGILCDSDDPKHWAEAISALLRDPVRLRRLREGARAAFLKHYAAECNYRQLLNIYQMTLADDLVGKT